MSTEPSCLLDTGVVIACLRGLAEVTSLLSHLVEKGPLAVSAITVLEVWQSTKEKEIKPTRAFFDGVRVIALDQSLAEKAGLLVQQLRRSEITISLPDASIAATALRLGIPILTTNRKHFAPVPHLQVWNLKNNLPSALKKSLPRTSGRRLFIKPLFRTKHGGLQQLQETALLFCYHKSMELLSIGKAAKRLGVHPNRLRAWEKQGLIRPVRLLSGQRRYPVEEINRILGAGGIKAKPDAVILYARVSTKKQADAGNLERQMERLRAYARVTPFSARLYGARGGRKIRQGFRELIRDAEEAEKG